MSVVRPEQQLIRNKLRMMSPVVSSLFKVRHFNAIFWGSPLKTGLIEQHTLNTNAGKQLS
jgi:hypothetical protein